MQFTEIFLIGCSLSADAFAVAVCKGSAMKRRSVKNILLIALFFGGFQALMPLLGWWLGDRFKVYIEQLDHWIAFVLLATIGGKMMIDSMKPVEETDLSVDDDAINLLELLALSVATSIDALAVGIVFAMANVNIRLSVLVIGLTTFVLSGIGVLLGHRLGNRLQLKAQFAGGVFLVLIGLKILLEYLGILLF